MSAILEAKVDRIEKHQEYLKRDQKEILASNIIQNETLKRIEYALMGNELNGNKGLVHEIEELNKLKDLTKTHKIYFAFIGFILIAGGVISSIFKQVFK
jgi:hypothetical protein